MCNYTISHNAWWCHRMETFSVLLALCAGNQPVIREFPTQRPVTQSFHYGDVIMTAMASQITSLTIVCSNVYLDTDQRKHQSSASLTFVRGIHRWPVNSPHKGPVTRKIFPFDYVTMLMFSLIGAWPAIYFFRIPWIARTNWAQWRPRTCRPPRLVTIMKSSLPQRKISKTIGQLEMK